jgi:hypothetical protein
MLINKPMEIDTARASMIERRNRKLVRHGDSRVGCPDRCDFQQFAIVRKRSLRMILKLV